MTSKILPQSKRWIPGSLHFVPSPRMTKRKIFARPRKKTGQAGMTKNYFFKNTTPIQVEIGTDKTRPIEPAKVLTISVAIASLFITSVRPEKAL